MVPRSASRDIQSRYPLAAVVLRAWLVASTLLVAAGYRSPVAAESAAAGSDTAGAEKYLGCAIYDQLAADKSLRVRELEVEIVDGRVVLRGVVDNLQARQAAEKSIRNRIGVRRITNLLQVENATVPSEDLPLSGRVGEALGANPYLSGREISITTAGNRVQLGGVVESVFQKEQAGKTAAAVEGVAGVDNLIAVVENPLWALTAGPQTRNVSDPLVSAIIDSYYRSLGVNPELAFKLDTTTNLAAGWKDSLDLNPPKAGGKPRVVNPETRYYEGFDFVGLGIYLIKKAFGLDVKKDKKKDKD